MSHVGRQMLETLLDRQVLAESAAYELLIALTDSAMAPAMAGAILSALRVRGVTAEEVRGFARAMRSLARRPEIPAGTPVADVVGTGGDGSHSLNLSTGAALLAAASGIRIAKHGNRSVSSRCGSADVLEALGVVLPSDAAAAIQCLDRTGFTFLFAPYYHPAMKAVAPVRAALGVRTVFNLLGPLANPAGVPHAVIGAWSLDVARLMAETLSGMEITRMFVVHGDGGWDEPSPAAIPVWYPAFSCHLRNLSTTISCDPLTCAATSASPFQLRSFSLHRQWPDQDHQRAHLMTLLQLLPALPAVMPRMWLYPNLVMNSRTGHNYIIDK
jgi:anthranilate phosphoribosyltransferase